MHRNSEQLENGHEIIRAYASWISLLTLAISLALLDSWCDDVMQLKTSEESSVKIC
jgi:hypothetical protein